jgi:hypothetical protein
MYTIQLIEILINNKITLLFREKKGRDDGLLGPAKTEKTRQTEREKRRKTFK